MVHTRKGKALPPVSRRAVLGGLAAPLLPGARAAVAAEAGDPALPLWADWRRASETVTALAAEWSALETRVARQVGFPRVAVPAADGGAPVWVTTHGDIDAFLAELDDTGLGPQLHAGLAARLALWRDAADRLGLDAVDARLQAALALSNALAESLIRVRASSLAGAIAKLELILHMGETSADDDDFPWGWLRAAITDLRRLAVERDAAQSV